MTRKLLTALLLLLLLPVLALADGLNLSVPKSARGFDENRIEVTVPAAGRLTVTVGDSLNTYRVLMKNESVQAGKQVLLWDGFGPDRERLDEKAYRVRAVLTKDDGSELEAKQAFTLQNPKQGFIYVLSGAEQMTPANRDSFFFEYDLIRDGGVTVSVAAADKPQLALGQLRFQGKGNGVRKWKWNGSLSRKALAAGDYVLTFCPDDNPSNAESLQLTITDIEITQPVQKTGGIMPESGDDDAAVWRKMMQPAVVVDIKNTSHQQVYAQPSKKSAKLGELHGQSQCLEVLEPDANGWTKIKAWVHESSNLVEGYVPTEMLKIVQPRSEYGLLISKTDQSLTIYRHGERLGSLKVSTGKIRGKKAYQETTPGSFLTQEHMADYSMNGLKYDHVIRYDGGNLLHQIPYAVKRGERDYSVGTSGLGEKASHGCVRVQAGSEGYTMQWLFTHIPFGTRVIVLPEGTEGDGRAQTTAAQAIKQDAADPLPLQTGETEIVMTLGGDVVLGTREAWRKKPEALPAVLADPARADLFAGLKQLFLQDDWTLVNLECVLKADAAGEQKDKLYRFRGDPAYAAMLQPAGIDGVNIANNHFIDYGKAGRASTLAALDAVGMPYCGFEQLFIREFGGHRIGFAGCRETVWKRDRGVIKRDVAKLRSLGCDVIVYSTHWGTEYSPTHNDLQEQMAQELADAGVEIIVGTHPHVVQGVDTRGGALVLWSLGNLMFGGTHDMQTFDATLAELRLRFGMNGYEGVTVRMIPVLTSSAIPANDFHPQLAQGEDRQRILQAIELDSGYRIKDGMYFPYAAPDSATKTDLGM